MIEQSIIECVSNANNFYEIACYCENKMIMFHKQYMSVFATNLSFSCELLIKAILMKEKGELSETHHLEKLFSNLSLETQNMIEIEFNKKKYISSLKDTLKKCDNVFVDFRYLYEKKKNKEIHTTDLSNLANSLRIVCAKKFNFNIE